MHMPNSAKGELMGLKSGMLNNGGCAIFPMHDPSILNAPQAIGSRDKRLSLSVLSRVHMSAQAEEANSWNAR